MRAGSVWVFTTGMAGCDCGRIRAKPARRRAYAARIPKAMEPTDAQTSIVKFNRSDRFIRHQSIACAAACRRRGDFRNGTIIACG